MSYVKLRRPREDATEEEVAAYRREVAAAQASLGIGYGEEFVVMAVSADGIYSLDAHDQRSLGPFSGDSETARLAALANYPRSGKQRHAILMAVVRAGVVGLTREEIAAKLGLEGNSVRPRVKELVEGGWLKATNLKRMTRGGNDSEVLVATDQARAEAKARGESGLWS